MNDKKEGIPRSIQRISKVLMRQLSAGINIIDNHFELYRQGEEFDLYHMVSSVYKSIPKGQIELAVLRSTPRIHYHTDFETSWFCFLDSNGSIQYGGVNRFDYAMITKVAAQKGVFYPVPPFIYHAGGPNDESIPTMLFIYNEGELRERSDDSNYTKDSHFTERILYVDIQKKIYQEHKKTNS